jgi:hypothetical protein
MELGDAAKTGRSGHVGMVAELTVWSGLAITFLMAELA